jgi:hypothetical protein
MTRPTIRIHDTQTDTIIDREMTDEEFTQHEAYIAAIAAQEVAEAEAKAVEETAKQQAFNDAVAAAVAVALAAQQS